MEKQEPISGRGGPSPVTEARAERDARMKWVGLPSNPSNEAMRRGSANLGFEVRDKGIFVLGQKDGPELPTHPTKGKTWATGKRNSCYLVHSIEAVDGDSVSVRTVAHCEGMADQGRDTVRWERGRGPPGVS